jgi:hypothetical protein
MAQMSAAPISAAEQSAPRGTPETRSARAAARRDDAISRQAEPDRMGVAAYLLQGGAFIGFLLVLFVLAGFRG